MEVGRLYGLILTILGLISCIRAEVNIVTRLEWNAKEPANALTELELPVGRIIIAHTAGNVCNTKVNIANYSE